MKKPIPFSFVLEELENSSIASRIQTKPMFGAHAVYVDEPWGVRRFFVKDPFGKIVNILEHF